MITNWILFRWLVLVLSVLLVVLLVRLGCNGQQDSNQFDQILRDLDILTRQQLQAQANVESTTGKSTTATTITIDSVSIPKKLPTSLVKSAGLDSSDSINNGGLSSSSVTQKVFRLPSSYDPNKLPRFSRTKPIVVMVNMTILHVNLDKQEVSRSFLIEVL